MSTDYDALEQALSGPQAPLAAAEAHGVLCGALSAANSYSLNSWLDEALGDEQTAAPSREVLAAVYEHTERVLSAGDMDFNPLLPDDDAPLQLRVAALSEWCGGYLYGLGAGGMRGLDDLAGEVGEVLRDFTEISRAEIGAGDPEDVNESAYAELVEFVRAGTQLVYDELTAMRTGAPPRPH
jgi:uncharacterized protein YgfB (UPF0149 family)